MKPQPLREHDFNRHGIQRIKSLPVEWRRAGQIRKAVEAYWQRHHPNDPLVWGRGEERATRDLVQQTRLCGLDLEKLIRNREHAPGTDHRQRPSRWIRDLPKYVRTPSSLSAVSA